MSTASNMQLVYMCVASQYKPKSIVRSAPRLQYKMRVDVERDSFIPLVTTTSGGLGKAATVTNN